MNHSVVGCGQEWRPPRADCPQSVYPEDRLQVGEIPSRDGHKRHFCYDSLSF